MAALPAPSGSHTVGCVDVMHNDLLVRLTYPTSPDSVGHFEYTKYYPHQKYVEATKKYYLTYNMVTKEAYKTLEIGEQEKTSLTRMIMGCYFIR